MRANRTAGVDGRDPEQDAALTGVLEATGVLRAQVAAVAAARRGGQLRGSVTVDTLAAALGQAAGIVDHLAAELAEIRDALEQEAYTASRYGVKIGIDGRPPPVLAGPPADAAAMSERHWALAYQQAFERAMAAARQARRRAASQLMDLSATIDGPVGHRPGGGGSSEERVQDVDDRGRQAGRGEDGMVRAATNSSDG